MVRRFILGFLVLALTFACNAPVSAIEYVEQSQTYTVLVGPFVDKTNGADAETALTISQADVQLSKNGAALAQKGDATSCTHRGSGFYSCPLSTTDTGTLGVLTVSIQESADALPVWKTLQVVPSNVYDSLVGGTDVLTADVTQIGGAAQSATDLKDFADDGYNPTTNNVAGVTAGVTVTTNNDKTGYSLAASQTFDNTGTWTGNVTGSVGSVTGAVGSVTGTVGAVAGNVGGNVIGSIGAITSGALEDFFSINTGSTYATSVPGSVVKEIADNAGGGTPPTASEIADAVWDEDIVAAHNTSDTAGEILDDLNTPNNFKATGFSTHSAADVWTSGTRTLTAGTKDSEIDLILADTGELQTNQNWNVWDDGTRTLTDLTGFSLSAAGIDAIWDEPQSGHVTAGTFGLYLDAQVSTVGGGTLTAAQIWDYDISGVVGAGYAGNYLNDLGTPADFMADVSGLATSSALATVQTDLDNPNQYKADVSNLDATVSSRSSHSAADVWSVVTRALTDKAGFTISGTKTTLDALNDVSAAEVNAQADLALADYDPPTKAELDSGFAALNDPTVGAIADQVWEEAIADHSGTSGSTAEALNAAGSAGDPWTTSLPGAYGAGTAGYLVGTYLDTAVSGVGGDDAATVWGYATRTLTDPNSYKADVSALATSAEVAALNDLTAQEVRDAMKLNASAGAEALSSIDRYVKHASIATSMRDAKSLLSGNPNGTNTVTYTGTVNSGCYFDFYAYAPQWDDGLGFPVLDPYLANTNGEAQKLGRYDHTGWTKDASYTGESVYELIGVKWAAGCAGGITDGTLTGNFAAYDTGDVVVTVDLANLFGGYYFAFARDGGTFTDGWEFQGYQQPSTLSTSVEIAALPTVGEIADAVWDETIPGQHVTTNTAGSILLKGIQSNSVHDGTAQAGAASTITLDTGAVATDNFYNHNFVVLTGGTGAGQVRSVQAYTGSTRVADVTPNWVTNPDATSTFSLLAMGEVHAREVHEPVTTDAASRTASQADVTALALEASLQALNDISVSDIWDEPTAGHQTAGTTGLALTSGSAPTVGEIADAVWDEAQADHTGAGTTGESLDDAGTAGDPWGVDIASGGYTGSQAGNIVAAKLARESTLLGELEAGVLQGNITLTGDDADQTIVRGDVTTLTFNTGRDLAGKKVYFTAKGSPYDDNADAVIGPSLATITDAAAGVATYTTTEADTAVEANLYYDVEVRESDDTSPSTAFKGRLNITQDVTQ